ncbi:hypothetical protein OESDEN_15011 [Oesophagostomum dentatum]|uniref:Uncharacterized protein n=1 Tax=Oesophagostomum dentatum TaxID=61180 RepID=A0A0B1SN07_OESDE|nr:hypothetical protein OESDEN_15011 [Oesophagostomum dentatum]
MKQYMLEIMFHSTNCCSNRLPDWRRKSRRYTSPCVGSLRQRLN